MSDAAKNFGLYLKELREGRDLSLRDVEDLVGQGNGVSFGHLAAIEQGGRDIESLSIRVLVRLAQAYRTPLHRLLLEAAKAMNGEATRDPEEESLLRAFQALSPHGRRYLLSQLPVARDVRPQTLRSSAIFRAGGRVRSS
jgi:transcriptional regulator with XRE-family HTH domain